MASADLQAVSGFLIAGFVVFLIGAALWRVDRYELPLPEALKAIGSEPGRWRWIHGWMIAGVAVSITGLTALAAVMAGGGERVYVALGAALFAVGGLVWIVGASQRMTTFLRFATKTVETGTAPEGAESWGEWFYVVHTLHLVSAYLSWTLLGSAVLASGVAPVWVGWLGIGLGLFSAGGYAAMRGGPFAPPILAHLYPLILGIAVLVVSF